MTSTESEAPIDIELSPRALLVMRTQLAEQSGALFRLRIEGFS